MLFDNFIMIQVTINLWRIYMFSSQLLLFYVEKSFLLIFIAFETFWFGVKIAQCTMEDP